jgi:hypothetical protein
MWQVLGTRDPGHCLLRWVLPFPSLIVSNSLSLGVKQPRHFGSQEREPEEGFLQMGVGDPATLVLKLSCRGLGQESPLSPCSVKQNQGYHDCCVTRLCRVWGPALWGRLSKVCWTPVWISSFWGTKLECGVPRGPHRAPGVSGPDKEWNTETQKYWLGWPLQCGAQRG